MSKPLRMKKMRVKPTELEGGDVFRHQGSDYRVTEVRKGRYGTYDVICQRLQAQRIGFDYNALIEVRRSATEEGQS